MRRVFEVHALATLFEPSPLGQCNTRAFIEPVAAPTLLFQLLERSSEMATRTQGLFDVTVGGLVSFFRSPRSAVSQDSLETVREGVGHTHLTLSPQTTTVRLTHPRTAIDLNGIAKGFAVERAAEAIRETGVKDFLINAGGEIYAAGRAPDRMSGWRVRIEAQQPDAPPVLEVVLRDQAIATSGNGRQPLTTEGGSHALHLFDPRRKLACDGLASASIVAASPTEADAWSTAAFVAGSEASTDVLAHQQNLQAYLVTKESRIITL